MPWKSLRRKTRPALGLFVQRRIRLPKGSNAPVFPICEPSLALRTFVMFAWYRSQRFAIRLLIPVPIVELPSCGSLLVLHHPNPLISSHPPNDCPLCLTALRLHALMALSAVYCPGSPTASTAALVPVDLCFNACSSSY